VTAVIHWFRRDLRVADNTALAAASRDGSRVVPVFLLDDHYGEDPGIGPARFGFLRESLEALSSRLAALGGRLVVRPGPAASALPELLRETGASAVYANSEIGPYPQARDARAAAAVADAGGRLRLFADELLVEPGDLLRAGSEPFRVFTPFWNRWREAEKRDPIPAPAHLETPPVRSVPIGKVRAWKDLPAQPLRPKGGEAEAAAALDRFVSGRLARYAADRDAPARDGTSVLSPHLHFGTISARTVRARVLAAASEASAAGSARRFLSELAWREFFHHLLFHFPEVAERSFRPEFDRVDWREDPHGFEAWKTGRTGFPFVDAGMRQLSGMHWMHNRARMAVASFLTKDLRVHWRVGERWFAHELADADLANNNGGWQWVSGSGADAAPFFRVFNPVLQGKTFDPGGEYVRRWVPELSGVPSGKIHEPWTMTPEEQREAGCRIGLDYPAPIVDHAAARRAALELFERIRRSR
jgi:deoxyribodipyrimidine photo-lyase